MTGFRRSIMQHRALAVWLVAAALAMKLLVPAGFMPVASAGSITFELCTGYGPQKMTMAMPGMAGKQGQQEGQGKMEMPCPFAGLSMPGVTGADPLLLIAAIAFVLALGLLITPRPLFGRMVYLRPPLRGPPTAA